jgi:hypothetical protein
MAVLLIERRRVLVGLVVQRKGAKQKSVHPSLTLWPTPSALSSVPQKPAKKAVKKTRK